MSELSPLKTAAIGALEFAAMTTDKTLEGFSQSTAFEKPEEGGNHAMWVAGHLARTYDWVLDKYGEKATLPAVYADVFAAGKDVEEDEEKYPPFDHVVAALSERRQSCIKWFTSLSEEKAAEVLDEEARMFGQTFAGMMGALGAHENFHAGQLSVVRKKLGMGRVFG